MTLRHLEIFVAVCQAGSVTRAAQQLHISQPTVSVAVRELEEHYGTSVFDRISHKLRITPFGQDIYDYALRLLNLYADTVNAKPGVPEVRVATGTAIGKLFIPTVIKSFLAKHPEVKVRACVGDATRMYRLVMDNEVDFVIAETVDLIPGLAHHSIQHYPVVPVCHRENPICHQEFVTAQELARENLLLREPSASTRAVVDTYFQMHNISVEPLLESYSVQSLFNAAKEGLGVAFLSLDHVLACRDRDLMILNIPDFHAERYVNVAYYKDKIFTPPMQAFLTHYETYTNEALRQGIQFYQKNNPLSTYVFPPL